MSAPIPVSVLVGNPRPNSRTLALAEASAGLIRSGLVRCGVCTDEPDLVDLAELVPALARYMVDGGDPTGQIARTQARMCRPGLLIVVSPTFNGSYTGLLKLFLDLLPRRALTDAVALPVMTASYSGHRFVVDTYLRPLLTELGATVPVAGLSVIEREFAQLEDAIDNWSDTRLPVLAAVLHHAAAGRWTFPADPALENAPTHGALTLSHAQEGSS